MIKPYKLNQLWLAAVASMFLVAGCTSPRAELRATAWFKEHAKKCEKSNDDARRAGSDSFRDEIWTGVVKELGKENLLGLPVVLGEAERLVGKGEVYVSGEPFNGTVLILVDDVFLAQQPVPVVGEKWAFHVVRKTHDKRLFMNVVSGLRLTKGN